MSENQPEQPKKRDGGLAFWLVIILLGNTMFLLSQVPSMRFLFFPLGTILLSIFDVLSTGGLPLWSIPLFIIYSIISTCSIIAVFMWRKLGFYAICLTAIAGFITSIVAGILTLAIIVNSASIVILSILLRTEWKLFR